MPIININIPGGYDSAAKQSLFDFCAETIHQNTSTAKSLIYVFLNEYNSANCRKMAPVINIDWTEDGNLRGVQAKQSIMRALTDYLHAMTNCNRAEIVVIINDLPPTNTCLGGLTRAEKPA